MGRRARAALPSRARRPHPRPGRRLAERRHPAARPRPHGRAPRPRRDRPGSGDDARRARLRPARLEPPARATVPGIATASGARRPRRRCCARRRSWWRCCLRRRTPPTCSTPAASALLPPGARLINAGRGTLIDDAALLDALDAGRLAHATLDVFREEPLPPRAPLLGAPPRHRHRRTSPPRPARRPPRRRSPATSAAARTAEPFLNSSTAAPATELRREAPRPAAGVPAPVRSRTRDCASATRCCATTDAAAAGHRAARPATQPPSR